MGSNVFFPSVAYYCTGSGQRFFFGLILYICICVGSMEGEPGSGATALYILHPSRRMAFNVQLLTKGNSSALPQVQVVVILIKGKKLHASTHTGAGSSFQNLLEIYSTVSLQGPHEPWPTLKIHLLLLLWTYKKHVLR
ncbi:hypothetical protein PSTT_10780 [Puccinia striiformis]|uniref:Uncharacterized protein n=1 Tax=Puccinia striiformis TaxID=27350 RepID=A0A2S4V342_9BASI|nr:hypothetical protein PSTT_10780 [Puccinia striiformis]